MGLLLLLVKLQAELGVVLSVVHFNHKLRALESERDAEFVANLAGEHKLELYISSGDVAQCAREERVSVETAARQLRYSYFEELLTESSGGKSKLDKIVTGHTLDDQAETVLMRVVRGTGLRGLRGIQPRIECGSGEVVRPLLTLRRHELEQYLGTLGQSWRPDSSNADTKFTRNRVRQRLLPLIESEFNPSVVENLSELAEIARGEEDYWENEAAGWRGTVVQWVASELAPSEIHPPLVQLALKPAKGGFGVAQESCSGPMHCMIDLRWLESEPLGVQRRVLRTVADDAGLSLAFQQIDEILRFAAQGPGRQLALPFGWQVVHQGDTLDFRPPGMRARIAGDYEYHFNVPGRVRAPEAGLTLEVVSLSSGTQPAGYHPDLVFDPALLGKELVLRNWRPGDRFWPAHTKSAKKLKELFEEHHVPRTERGLWPVLVSGNEIVWVRGFPGRAQMRPVEGEEALLIREAVTSDP